MLKNAADYGRHFWPAREHSAGGDALILGLAAQPGRLHPWPRIVQEKA